MKLSSIISQKKDSKRVSIFIDGKFVCGLSSVVWAEYGVHIGDEIAPEVLRKLQLANEEEKYFDSILHFLSFRPRSEKEVEDKLFSITHQNNELIQKTLSKLKKYEYVNDDSFSRWWVEQRTKQGKGKRLIFQELLQKGVDRKIIEKVLQEEEIAGSNEALGVLEKSRWRFKNFDNKDKRKMQNMLLRRGFTGDDVYKVVDDFLTKGK